MFTTRKSSGGSDARAVCSEEKKSLAAEKKLFCFPIEKGGWNWNTFFCVAFLTTVRIVQTLFPPKERFNSDETAGEKLEQNGMFYCGSQLEQLLQERLSVRNAN